MDDGAAPRWVVLGAGSILPRAGYGCAGYALVQPDGPHRVTLFDCGPGTVRALGAAGLPLAHVSRVVISHFHPDHCLDLFALAFARRNPKAGELPALDLVGPRGLEQRVDAGREVFGRWVAFEDTTFVEVDPADEPATPPGHADLSCIATGHTPEALAWRGETRAGRAVVFSGDTGEDERVARLARGVELFVAECALPEGAEPRGHLTGASAGRLAASAGCARLVLSHFYPDVDPERARADAARAFAGPIELARDGSVFRF